ncbi:MAG: hypothetical protein CFE44_18440 [Burkholderiales bacterium PBB4]|nr:MAG: hypothetical protein CFE44_18440 [Burkholderiales bacterium PBB4]
MFILGKVLGLLAQPLVWVAALLMVALLVWGRKPRLGRALGGTALAVLLLVGWLALADLGVRALESRYVELAPDADLSGYVGVVLLGGAMGSGNVAQAHRQPVLNSAAERMSAAAALLIRHPQLPLVFTGGEGALLGTGPNEAERARLFFDSLGIAAHRVRYESASRNTYENAVLTAALPGIDRQGKWLLLTSAWHMPRSMATFEKAGWNVTAYPVDYRTGFTTPWTDYDLQSGAEQWQLLLHEWLGIVAYRLTGRL